MNVKLIHEPAHLEVDGYDLYEIPASSELWAEVNPDHWEQVVAMHGSNNWGVMISIPELGYEVAQPLPSFQHYGVTKVGHDYPEGGWAQSIDLPYRFLGDALTVVSEIEGWCPAVSTNREYSGGARSNWERLEFDLEHPFLSTCERCMWATGEICLPCTVNPLGFAKEECRDFEVLS